MWKLSDIVVYGSSGICEITDIREQDFCGEKKTYYILKPLYDSKTLIHVPSFNEKLMSKIKPILDKEEALNLIKKIPEIAPFWIENDKQRMEEYKGILDSGKRESVISIIKALHLRQEELREKGKKMRSSDEYFFSDAKKLFENECAYIFSLEKEQVADFIVGQFAT